MSYRFNEFFSWVIYSFNLIFLDLYNIFPINPFFSDFTFLVN